MAYDKSIESLQADYKDVWEAPGWQDFRRIRKAWDEIIRRSQSASQDYNLLVAKYGVDANVLSPVLEQTIGEHVDILLSTAAKVDAQSLDTHETAKDNVEDIRIALAVSLRNQDEGQAWSREIFEAMVRYGFYAGYKTWEMPREGDYSKPDDFPTLAKWAQRILKERKDHYDQYDKPCFGRETVHPLEIAFWPLSSPTVYIQESIITYREARGLKNRDGKSFRMRKDKSILFGETEPPEEVAPSAWGSEKIRRTRRAKLDPETGIWHVTEWVRGESANVSDAQELDDFECPFNHSPYFIAAGGQERVTEQSPHLRFRPKIYPLLVEVDQLNTYASLMLKRTIYRLENPFVVTFYGVQADVMAAMMAERPEMGTGVLEGAGAQRKYTWTLPQAGSDEIMMVPRLDPLPDDDVQGLIENINRTQANIDRLRANRWLLGGGEVDGNPATSVIDQHQAARTPYGGDITSSDLLKKDWLTAETDAICYWDKTQKGGKSYSYRTTADEPVARDPREAGDVVALTADKIKAQRWALKVHTENESDQERMLRQQAADNAYQLKRITKEQWLRGDSGPVTDPRKQLVELERERREEMSKPFEDAIAMQEIQTFFAAFAGLDPNIVGQQQGVGAEQQQLTQGQTTPPPRPGVHSGTAPALQGVSGGSSAVEGV